MSELGPICLIFGRRSGTSSLAKALFEAGYPLRGPIDCRPFPAQPDGHYENVFARGINQGILEHYHMKPGVPGLVPFQKCQPLGAWADRHPGPFIVKDPGLDLTWPVWLRTLALRKIVGIWCWRDPQERRASLQKNYAIPPDNAKWAVEMYDLCVAAATQHVDCLRLDLEEPFRIKRATAWLDLHGIHHVPGDPEPRRILSDEDPKEKDPAPCPS